MAQRLSAYTGTRRVGRAAVNPSQLPELQQIIEVSLVDVDSYNLLRFEASRDLPVTPILSHGTAPHFRLYHGSGVLWTVSAP